MKTESMLELIDGLAKKFTGLPHELLEKPVNRNAARRQAAIAKKIAKHSKHQRLRKMTNNQPMPTSNRES